MQCLCPQLSECLLWHLSENWLIKLIKIFQGWSLLRLGSFLFHLVQSCRFWHTEKSSQLLSLCVQEFMPFPSLPSKKAIFIVLCECECSWQGGWNQIIFKALFNPYHSMISQNIYLFLFWSFWGLNWEYLAGARCVWASTSSKGTWRFLMGFIYLTPICPVYLWRNYSSWILILNCLGRRYR